jgi:Holliday junction resolvase RusA-like endonuclease
MATGKDELRHIEKKQVLTMLKMALDFNTGIVALATQVVAAESEGKRVKMKHVQRDVDNMTKQYQANLQFLFGGKQ